MLLVLAASTDMMSSEHTSRFLAPLMRWIMPDIQPEAVAFVQLIVRKLAHLTEYGVLAALLARALCAGSDRLRWQHVMITLGVASLCAASDEFHQSFVASRTGSLIDFWIDIAGAILGVWIYWRFTRQSDLVGKHRREGRVE